VSAELEPVTRTFGTTVVKDDALAAYATHATLTQIQKIKYTSYVSMKIELASKLVWAASLYNTYKRLPIQAM
jgi:hypothetical protein